MPARMNLSDGHVYLGICLLDHLQMEFFVLRNDRQFPRPSMQEQKLPKINYILQFFLIQQNNPSCLTHTYYALILEVR